MNFRRKHDLTHRATFLTQLYKDITVFDNFHSSVKPQQRRTRKLRNESWLNQRDESPYQGSVESGSLLANHEPTVGRWEESMFHKTWQRGDCCQVSNRPTLWRRNFGPFYPQTGCFYVPVSKFQWFWGSLTHLAYIYMCVFFIHCERRSSSIQLCNYF